MRSFRQVLAWALAVMVALGMQPTNAHADVGAARTVLTSLAMPHDPLDACGSEAVSYPPSCASGCGERGVAAMSQVADLRPKSVPQRLWRAAPMLRGQTLRPDPHPPKIGAHA